MPEYSGKVSTLKGIIGGISSTKDNLSNNHAILLNRTEKDQHPIEAITGLDTQLDSKASDMEMSESGVLRLLNSDGEQVGSSVQVFTGGNSIPISSVTGLETELDLRGADLSYNANGVLKLVNSDGTPIGHSVQLYTGGEPIPISSVTGLQTALDGKGVSLSLSANGLLCLLNDENESVGTSVQLYGQNTVPISAVNGLSTLLESAAFDLSLSRSGALSLLNSVGTIVGHPVQICTNNIGHISLVADDWEGGDPYTQTVTFPNSTTDSKIDLQPSTTVLQALIADGVSALCVANDSGQFTVYAVGAKPTTDMVVQYTMTRVQSNVDS